MSHDPAADAAEFDPAASLRTIQEQTERARDATEPDGRILFGAWGVAWLVGYLVLWASARSTGLPTRGAATVLACCIAAAMALTIVHSITRTAGVRGVSARTGAMYGWTWFLGFTSYGVVLGALGAAGASAEVQATAANGFACVLVGVMYLAGGMLFDETRMYVVGAWMLVTAAAAAFAGLPHTYLVMALAGGGGFLIMAVVEQVIRTRRRSRPLVAAPTPGGATRA